MTERGWTQMQTANKSGISQTMIGKILRGESAPTVDLIEKLAHAFRVSPLEILTEDRPGESLISQLQAMLDQHKRTSGRGAGEADNSK